MWADIFTDFERRETLGRPSDDDYACGMVQDGGAGLAYMQPRARAAKHFSFIHNDPVTREL